MKMYRHFKYRKKKHNNNTEVGVCGSPYCIILIFMTY